MSIAEQLSALVEQRNELAQITVELGGVLSENPTLKQIADALVALRPKAFAVYSEDDGSLSIYKRTGMPSEGDTFEGKTATAVYTGIEDTSSTSSSAIPWSSISANVTNAAIVDEGITPQSTASWFYNMSNLTELTGAEKLAMDQNKNMGNMFYGCSSIESVGNLDNWQTGNVTSMSGMFRNCSSLTSVGDLSGWQTGNVTNMSGMFYGCSLLTSVGDLDDWQTGKVTSMGSMFYNCSKLTSVGNLDDWQIGNVMFINAMFNGCKVLTSVGDLSNWQINKARSMREMFQSCSKLTSVGDLSGWDTSSVENTYHMFMNCGSLASVGNLDNWQIGKVTLMDSMFLGCSSLTTVGDLSGWDTGNATSMSGMFYGCSSLTELNLSGWDTSSVTSMSSMFYKCGGLTTLDLSSFDTSACTNMKSMFYNVNMLQQITLGERFSFIGAATSSDNYAILPTPSSTYITNADGMWHNESGSASYTPETMQGWGAMGATYAGTYYADAWSLHGVVTVSGTFAVGETVTAAVTKVQSDAYLEYSWSVSDVPSGSGTLLGRWIGSSYTITSSLVGKYIRCVVEDGDETYDGTIASDWTPVSDA